MEIPGNSTEGASNMTSAREPHAVINEWDKNLNWREMLDGHKWLIAQFPTMTPLYQKPFLREPHSPYHNPSRGKLEPSRPYQTIHFKLSVPTLAPPPPRTRVPVVPALVIVVGAFVALLIITAVRSGKASRTRREPGSPLDDDLPPAYYECALSSIKKYVSDEPPPYANYKHAEPHVHARRQSALIAKELGAKAVTMTTTSSDSGDVAPKMKTELVFDNGRIVERLSLDLDGNNVKTEIASNDNVEQQSTRHAKVKDRVTYVDETDNVTVNTQ